MNTTAVVIGVAYLVTVVVGALAAFALARSATRGAHTDHAKLARRENGWLVAVVVFLAALLLSTIWLTPYGDDDAAAGTRVVEITGAQFSWTIEPREVRAGEPIEFRVRATDVSHGFGLYDPDDKLVFQVQMLPGELQKEFATLTKPGVYRVVCLEFCGVSHHLMLDRLTVTAP